MAGKPFDTVLDIINKRMIPNEEAKRSRGEVFTPLRVVRELLYGVRKDTPSKVWGVNDAGEIFDDPAERIGGIPLELWTNLESKWLDPANGIGNFPYVAFQMLDFQLTKRIQKHDERRKHIVEKMLFMIEIDKGNVNTSLKIFEQLAQGSKPNICCADTLKLKDADLMKHFGVSKFDVVMGNPPFNTARELKGQTSILWDQFIYYSLNCLNPGGFLVFINPPNWRRPESKLYNDMVSKNQLVFLHIIGKSEGKKLFDATTRIDMYILEKVAAYKPTIIIDEINTLQLVNVKDIPFLPNYNFKDINNIMTNSSEGIKVIFSSSLYEHRRPHVKKAADSVFKFPIAHTSTQSGIGFLYTNDNTKGHFGVPKVLLNVNERQYPYNDYDGKYGMSQLTFGIPISSREEGDKIVRAVNSERFREIIKSTKWSTFQTDYRMFKYFKPDFYNEFLPKEGGIRHKTYRNRRRGTMRR